MREEIHNWDKAKQILDSHDMPTMDEARKLIPNQNEFIAQGVKKSLKWDPKVYKITR